MRTPRLLLLRIVVLFTTTSALSEVKVRAARGAELSDLELDDSDIGFDDGRSAARADPRTGGETWPPNSDLKLGQVAGIDLDSRGNVHVFHRGARVWDGSSFDDRNFFAQRHEGPIREATHVVLSGQTGRVLQSGGAGRFYMPHGLSVDHADNVWLTDVGLHQVFKIPPGREEPSLVLGTAFEPGADSRHFCKPTDVAVATTGEFFVADGYCNSRIVKFSPDGAFIMEFGKADNGIYPAPPGTFSVPHSLTLVEDWNLLCVADREHERIQCFSAGLRHDPRALPTGTFIRKAEGLGRVFALDNRDHYLIGVTNPGLVGSKSKLFVVDLETGESQVKEPGLQNPHDVAVSPDGMAYVAEIGPNRIRRIRL